MRPEAVYVALEPSSSWFQINCCDQAQFREYLAVPNREGELMINSRTLLAPSLSALLFSSAGMAQDLARYRDFQFGMSPEAVATQMKINPSAIRTTYRRRIYLHLRCH